MKYTKMREKRWTKISIEMIAKVRVGDIYVSEIASNSRT